MSPPTLKTITEKVPLPKNGAGRPTTHTNIPPNTQQKEATRASSRMTAVTSMLRAVNMATTDLVNLRASAEVTAKVMTSTMWMFLTAKMATKGTTGSKIRSNTARPKVVVLERMTKAVILKLQRTKTHTRDQTLPLRAEPTVVKKIQSTGRATMTTMAGVAILGHFSERTRPLQG